MIKLAMEGIENIVGLGGNVGKNNVCFQSCRPMNINKTMKFNWSNDKILDFSKLKHW